MAEKRGLLLYDLQFFAKDGPGGEKTEPATSKKLSDARNEGQVCKSKELDMAVTLVATFLMLRVVLGFIGSNFMQIFYDIYNKLAFFALLVICCFSSLLWFTELSFKVFTIFSGMDLSNVWNRYKTGNYTCYS